MFLNRQIQPLVHQKLVSVAETFKSAVNNRQRNMQRVKLGGQVRNQQVIVGIIRVLFKEFAIEIVRDFVVFNLEV